MYHQLSIWSLTFLFAIAARATVFSTYSPDTSGKEDVSALLQKAVNDAIATDKVLRIPPGTYWIASPVTLTTNGLTVTSTNPFHAGNVILRGSPAGTKPGTTPAEGAERKPIFLTRKPVYSLTIVGITFTDASVGVAGDPSMAVTYFLNCAFHHCDAGVSGDPIQIATFDRCHFTACGYGIRGRSPRRPASLNRSNLVNIYDSTFRACRDWAIQIEGSPVNIRDCDFEGNTGGVLELLDLYVGTVEGSYFEGNGGNGEKPMIRLAPDQLPGEHNGQLALRGNQINANHNAALIEIVNGSKLHAYDNRAAVKLSAGQVLIETDGPEENISLDHNIIRDPAIP